MADFPNNNLFLSMLFLPIINSNSLALIILISDVPLGFWIVPEINVLFLISPTSRTLAISLSI